MSLSPSRSEKYNLRRALLTARLAMAPDERQSLSLQIGTRLAAWIRARSCMSIFAFMPVKGEPDLTSLPDLLPEHEFAWPVIGQSGNDLQFRTWRPGQPLVNGRFGIPEPSADQPLRIGDRGTLLLVPALAIDQQGHRLGYGGGFYDRLLAQNQHITAVGIIYDRFFQEQVPAEPHDRQLVAVATESGVMEFKNAPLI